MRARRALRAASTRSARVSRPCFLKRLSESHRLPCRRPCALRMSSQAVYVSECPGLFLRPVPTVDHRHGVVKHLADILVKAGPRAGRRRPGICISGAGDAPDGIRWITSPDLRAGEHDHPLAETHGLARGSERDFVVRGSRVGRAGVSSGGQGRYLRSRPRPGRPGLSAAGESGSGTDFVKPISRSSRSVSAAGRDEEEAFPEQGRLRSAEHAALEGLEVVDAALDRAG